MNSKPEHFEVMTGYAIYRPVGHFTLAEVVQRVTTAIVYTRELRVKKLLVNLSSLTGFESPSLSERFYFIQEWARASLGSVQLAVVTRAEMIDPNKFGVVVAENHGLKTNVFTTEEAGLGWLLP